MTRKDVPFIISFYANQSQPSLILDGKVTNHINQAGGAVALGRVDVGAYPDVAEALRIESLPAFVAVYQGKAVDRAQGMPTEEQLKTLFAKLLKLGGSNVTSQLLEAGEELIKQNKIAEAIELYTQIMEQRNLQANGPAFAGILRCVLIRNEMDTAQEIANRIRKEFKDDLNNPYIKKALAELEAAISAKGDTPEIKELVDKVIKNICVNVEMTFF